MDQFNKDSARRRLFCVVEEMVKDIGKKETMKILYEVKNNIKEGADEQKTKTGTKRI